MIAIATVGLKERIAQRELTLPRGVDRLEQHPGGLLRRVEAGRVLRLDEVEEELRAALQVAGLSSSGSVLPASFAAFNRR